MNMFVYLRNLLLTIAPVTAIVGTGNNARIWNGWARSNAVPCIILDIDREVLQNDLSGTSDLTIADITITCRGNTHLESDALSDAVKAIAGHSGDFGFVFDSIVHSDTPKEDGSTGHWYDHVMDGYATWRESIP